MNQFFIKGVGYTPTDDFIGQFKNNLKQYKIIHLKDIPKDIDYKEFYSGLVDKLGEIINVDEDIKSGNANSHERWTDVRYDKAHDFTFRHANTRQPLHTDAAYTTFDQDINFFFCLENAEIGGATTFFDSDDLLYILEKYEPELLAALKNTEVHFGKGENQRKTRRIIDADNRGNKLNWNYYRIMPDNNSEVKELCEQFHKFLEEKIVMGGLLTSVALKPGECVFFQDDRVLHGRYSFYGNRTLIKGGFNFN